MKPNGLGGKAAAINSIGTIVGRADYDLNGNFVGCLWQDYDASPHLLNPPSGFSQSYAWAINNEGLVVGIYGPGVGANGQNPIEAAPATRYACAWRFVPRDKGAKFEVFPLFPDPPPLSFAWDINDNARIVGTFKDPGDGQRAFYTSVFWMPQDLNDLLEDPLPSGGILRVARSINNKQQIVGDVEIPTGGQRYTHAFLLSPI